MPNPFSSMSKGQLYATIGGTVAIGGYLAYKHHQTSGSWNPFSSSPSTVTTSTTIDPVTGLPYTQDNVVDPATGLTYLAEAQTYGSVAAAEADVTAYGQSSATGSGVGVSPATYPVSGSTQTGTAYTSDAAWSQAAQAGLTDIGYDGPTVAAALGAYLTATPLSTAQVTIVQAAIAEYGPPPVGTFQIIQQPASGPGTTTGTSAASAPGAVSGLSATGHAGFADFGWGVVSSASGYELLVTGAGGKGTGTSHVDKTTTGNHAEKVTLAPGAYKAQVRATNSAGPGPWSATQTFTVTK